MINLFIITWIAIVSLCLWVLYEKKRDPIFLFIATPLLLVLSAGTFFTIRSLMGFPIEGKPEGKFIYVSHLVQEPDWIYYWLVLKDETEPIAYKIPYSKKNHKNAEKAGKMKKNGIMAEGKFNKGSGPIGEQSEKGQGGQTLGGFMEFYRFPHELVIPKG